MRQCLQRFNCILFQRLSAFTCYTAMLRPETLPFYLAPVGGTPFLLHIPILPHPFRKVDFMQKKGGYTYQKPSIFTLLFLGCTTALRIL